MTRSRNVVHAWCILGSCAVALALPVTASAQAVSALSVQPRGAYAANAPGSPSVYQVLAPTQPGSIYHFTFTGDETIDYQIDTSDLDVRKGVIRIKEGTTDSYPIHDGGLAWRTASVIGNGSGHLHPAQLKATSNPVLYHEYLDPVTRKLTLKYDEKQNGVPARKTYEFWMVGKVLKVRAYGDPSNSQFIDNYGFVYPGPSAQTTLPTVPE